MDSTASLHFLGSAGVLDDQLATDIATAGGFSVPQLSAVAALVLDSLKATKVPGRLFVANFRWSVACFSEYVYAYVMFARCCQSGDLIASVERFGTENRVNLKALKVWRAPASMLHRSFHCTWRHHSNFCGVPQSIATSLLIFFKESLAQSSTPAHVKEDLVALRACLLFRTGVSIW
jgi:hypothetical protein